MQKKVCASLLIFNARTSRSKKKTMHERRFYSLMNLCFLYSPEGYIYIYIVENLQSGYLTMHHISKLPVSSASLIFNIEKLVYSWDQLEWLFRSSKENHCHTLIMFSYNYPLKVQTSATFMYV